MEDEPDSPEKHPTRKDSRAELGLETISDPTTRSIPISVRRMD